MWKKVFKANFKASCAHIHGKEEILAEALSSSVVSLFTPIIYF